MRRRIVSQRLFRIAVPILITAGIAAGLMGAYRSPLFQVRTVEVHNSRYVDPDAVVEASGLVGQNILSLHWRGGAERIRQIPMVRSVDIQRQFPNSVRIILHEREPWGVWEVAGGRYVVDRDGVVLNRGLPAEGAPVVMQIDGGKALAVGGSVDSDSLELIRELQNRLPETVPSGRAQAVAYEFRSKDGLTVAMRGGLRVTFGDSHDLEFKLSALRTLLTRAPDATYVDLRFGDRIVFQAPERSVRP